jgi:hypothetical protein
LVLGFIDNVFLVAALLQLPDPELPVDARARLARRHATDTS